MEPLDSLSKIWELLKKRELLSVDGLEAVAFLILWVIDRIKNPVIGEDSQAVLDAPALQLAADICAELQCEPPPEGIIADLLLARVRAILLDILEDLPQHLARLLDELLEDQK